MRVQVLLAVVVCGVVTVCVQSAQLPRPLQDWPKDILYPKTDTCDKAFPNFYSFDSCLATNRGDASASKCKHVVASCACIPQFVKAAVSRVARPNNPHRNVYICTYLVYKVGMRVPGCCTKYFQPNPSQMANNLVSGDAADVDLMLKKEYQLVISELKKEHAKPSLAGASAPFWDSDFATFHHVHHFM